MIEVYGDMWDHLGLGVLVITTNGSITKDGRAVLGRGCARQAATHFPGLPRRLGLVLQQQGNHVSLIGDNLASFPVEESAWSQPDLSLIRRSARELGALAEAHSWRRVIMPRPGCGGGGLLWSTVRPVLEDHLDDRFQIICLSGVD